MPYLFGNWLGDVGSRAWDGSSKLPGMGCTMWLIDREASEHGASTVVVIDQISRQSILLHYASVCKIYRKRETHEDVTNWER